MLKALLADQVDEYGRLPPAGAMPLLGLQPVAIAVEVQGSQLFARLADQVAFMGTSP